MWRASETGVRNRYALPGLPRVFDETLEIGRFAVARHNQDQGRQRGLSNHAEILDRVVTDIVVEMRERCERHVDRDQCVAVRTCPGDIAESNGTASTRFVLHNNSLTNLLRNSIRDGARDQVDRTAGREGNNK